MTKGTEAILVDIVCIQNKFRRIKGGIFFRGGGAGLGPKYVRHYTIQGLLKD
jgi:hypothetical protein